MSFLRVFRRHLAQHCIAYIALFFAMSGSAFAATAMWTGANIVDGSLTGADIQSGSISSTNLAPGATAPTPVVQFDSGTTTYDLPAYSAPDSSGRAIQRVLEHATISQATDGFMDFRLEGDVSGDATLSCSTADQWDTYVWANVQISIDGANVQDRSNPAAVNWDNGTGYATGFGNRTVETVWVPAGQHDVAVVETGATCAGTSTGNIHISNLHLVGTAA